MPATKTHPGLTLPTPKLSSEPRKSKRENRSHPNSKALINMSLEGNKALRVFKLLSQEPLISSNPKMVRRFKEAARKAGLVDWDVLKERMKGWKDSPNKFKVPKKQWRKWHEVARRVFNGTYQAMSHNRILYPESFKSISSQALRVAAWNSAWMAADAAEEAWRERVI